MVKSPVFPEQSHAMKSETPASQSFDDDLSLSRVVDRLCAADCGTERRWNIPWDRRVLPSRDALIQATEEIQSVLFPGYHDISEIPEDSIRFYVVYGAATVLGRITIGKGAVIGGNVWVTRSTPPASKITRAEFRQEKFSQGDGI